MWMIRTWLPQHVGSGQQKYLIDPVVCTVCRADRGSHGANRYGLSPSFCCYTEFREESCSGSRRHDIFFPATKFKYPPDDFAPAPRRHILGKDEKKKDKRRKKQTNWKKISSKCTQKYSLKVLFSLYAHYTSQMPMKKKTSVVKA